MTTRFTSEKQIRSSAWLLHAEFDVLGRQLLADIQTDKLSPEYIQESFDAPASYLNQCMKGLVLLSFSMPTAVLLTSCGGSSSSSDEEWSPGA